MIPPRAAHSPALAELQARAAAAEADLEQSIDHLGDSVREALNWRKVVEKHPVECALGAAALGFFVAWRSDVIGDSAGNAVKRVVGVGTEALVAAASAYIAEKLK